MVAAGRLCIWVLSVGAWLVGGGCVVSRVGGGLAAAPATGATAAGERSGGGVVVDSEPGAAMDPEVAAQGDDGGEHEIDLPSIPDKWLFDSSGEAVAFVRAEEVYTLQGVWIGSLDRHEIYRDGEYWGEIFLGERLVCNRFRTRGPAPASSARDTDRMTPPPGGRGRVALPVGFSDAKVKAVAVIGSPASPPGRKP